MLKISTARSLLWRHNGCDSVSNHQAHDCLPNRLFRRRSKKTSKLRVTGLWGPVNSPHWWPVTRKMFPFDDVIMWFLFIRVLHDSWVGIHLSVCFNENYFYYYYNKSTMGHKIPIDQSRSVYKSDIEYHLLKFEFPGVEMTKWPWRAITPIFNTSRKNPKLPIGANLVNVTQIYYKISRGQAEFSRILSQNGSNGLEGQDQWPPFSVLTENIPRCMFGGNIGDSNSNLWWVSVRTDGRTDGQA